MSSAVPYKWFVATAVVFCAISLSAQHYYGRDHHIYHPPAQSKHQTPQATNAHAHTTASTTATNTGHNASPASSQSIPYRGTSSSSKTDTMMPPALGDRQPQ